MERYNYPEAVREDVLEHIHENYTPEEITEAMKDRDEFAEKLNDELWIADSVTGNGSGSYTFSRAKAKDYVTDNPDELREALKEFCVEADTIANNFLNEDWEYFDVTIRCYLLGVAISEALDELETKYKY